MAGAPNCLCTMEPLAAALLDEACAEHESLGQVDGIVDSPFERPGRSVEVELLEKEERSMTGWCLVRRKGGQEARRRRLYRVGRSTSSYSRNGPISRD